jgi:hypothetical protein
MAQTIAKGDAMNTTQEQVNAFRESVVLFAEAEAMVAVMGGASFPHACNAGDPWANVVCDQPKQIELEPAQMACVGV